MLPSVPNETHWIAALSRVSSDIDYLSIPVPRYAVDLGLLRANDTGATAIEKWHRYGPQLPGSTCPRD